MVYWNCSFEAAGDGPARALCLSAPCVLPLLSKAAFQMLLVKCGRISSIYLHTKYSRVNLTYALQSFGGVFLPRLSHGQCLVFWGP